MKMGAAGDLGVSLWRPLQRGESSKIRVLVVAVIALGHETGAAGSPRTSRVLPDQQTEAAGGPSYLREWMKLSRLYSVSYCCWSHSSPRPSRTDFMEDFPEVDGDRSPLSLFSP